MPLDKTGQVAEIPGLTDASQQPQSLVEYVDHHYSAYAYKRSHYLDLLFELENSYPQFSSYIFNTGMPVFVEDPQLCPTSAVTFNMITKCIKYFWNTSFFDSLKDEEIKFVMIHETLHLKLNHLMWSRHMRYPEVWNIACDAVINDMIVNNFKDVKVPEWVVTGQKAVGQDCSNLSAEKVYNMLLDNATFITIKINGLSGDGDGQGDGDGDGADYEITVNGDCQNADDHSGWNDIPAERIDQIAKEVEKAFSNDKQQKTRGDGSSVGDRLVYKKKNEFSLRRYVKNIVSRRVDEEFTENWRRFNPKMATIYPDVILPYSLLTEARNTIELTFMVDVSGSVPDFLLDEFVAIARYHAKDHDVKTCSFDTAVHEFDLRTMTKIPGGGGTSFQAIVDWMVAKKPDYDAVFVLTDGYGGNIDASKINAAKWFWVICPDGCLVDKSYGTSVMIPQEYIDKRRAGK
jgi:predicted metal-dependent peptidase